MSHRPTPVRDRALFLAASLLAVLASTAVAEEATATEKASLRFETVNDGALGVFEGKRPVLVYNHGMQKPEGVTERYFRSGYVHPLYGLDGEVLTDDFPKDHYHHRGVFWAWPGVRIDGKKYDIWTLVPGIKSHHESFGKREINAGKAILEAVNTWRAAGRKVMREDVRIVVHPADANGQAIDFELAWTPLEKPVTLWGAAGKSYGGMTIRYAPRKDKHDVITVPSGRTEKDLSITKLEWADYTGKFAGAPGRSGAAIFIHPSHPDYPPTWLTRHYGALCVGWPGVEPKTFPPGKAVRCTYRVWVHRGNPDAQAIQKVYDAWGAETREAR